MASPTNQSIAMGWHQPTCEKVAKTQKVSWVILIFFFFVKAN